MSNPKSKFARSLEIATNFSIIIVAVIGATVLVKTFLLRAPRTSGETNPASVGRNATGLPDDARVVRTSSAPPLGPLEGTQISLPGVSWQDSNQTVLLALSDKCHYCSESAPFYQRLAHDLAKRSDVRLVALFPQSVDAGKHYLDQLGIPVGQVIQASLASVQVRGTPTLLIVDKNGAVMQSWVGKLNSAREFEVLNRIKI